MIWGHMKVFLVCAESFHSVCFFALKVMKGHDFWTHLQMCPELVDLFPPILES